MPFLRRFALSAACFSSWRPFGGGALVGLLGEVADVFVLREQFGLGPFAVGVQMAQEVVALQFLHAHERGATNFAALTWTFPFSAAAANRSATALFVLACFALLALWAF